jgi:tyrosinase
MYSQATDRRGFLKQATGACAAGITAAYWGQPQGSRLFAGASDAPLVRKNIAEFAQDASSLTSFRKGIQKMRGLKPTDPRSWIFQANIHWRPFFPVYVYQQALKSTDAAQQLFQDDPGFAPNPNVFNQCPHGDWWFLPWHRAYLYFFERILRWAANDPKLTLPYWNYSDPNQRELPKVFRDAQVNGADNPLYLPESTTFTDDEGQPQVFLMRDGPMLRGETQLTPAVTSLNALATIPFSSSGSAPTTSGFGSPQACDPSCFCGPGALENIPHNRIHTAVGGSSSQAGGALRIGFMGDISTAARDPIFWLHHSNIDRLWASWLNLKQDRKNPDDPVWLQYPLVFFDVDKDGNTSPVTFSAQQVLATESLGYVYDKLEPLPTLVAARPPTPAVSSTGQTLAATAPPKPAEGKPHAMAAGGIQLTTARRQDVTVPLATGVKPEHLVAALAAKPEERKGEVVLSLEGIEFDQLPGVDYDVYLNLPDNAEPKPDSPYYVGTLTLFGMAHPKGPQGHGGHKVPRYVKFALPEGLRKALAGQGESLKEFKVTFVPETGTEPVRKGANVAARADRPAVTIRQVRLLTMR